MRFRNFAAQIAGAKHLWLIRQVSQIDLDLGELD